MPDTSTSAAAAAEPAVSLRDILRVLIARRWVILATALAVVAACTGYVLLVTPTYRAETVVAPAESERSMGGLSAALGQLGSIASLAGVGGLDSKNAASEEALAVLRSREFIERFITDHNLLPRLFPGRWDSVAQRWHESWYRRTPTMARGVNRFNEKVLSALKDRKNGFVTVVIEWRDRSEAAIWANELVARLNAEMRSRSMAKAVAYTGFLEKELASTQLVETRAAISRLIEEQLKQRMVASVTQDYAFRTIGHAAVPDADDYASPQQLPILLGGLVLGLVAGTVLALLLAARQNTRRRGGAAANR